MEGGLSLGSVRKIFFKTPACSGVIAVGEIATTKTDYPSVGVSVSLEQFSKVRLEEHTNCFQTEGRR